MNNLIELGGDGLLALFHGKNGESLIPKPFERDIFLLDTHVAGTTHIEGIDELEPYLKSGDRLNLFESQIIHMMSLQFLLNNGGSKD